MRPLTLKSFLAAVLTLGIIGLSGCGGDNGNGPTGPSLAAAWAKFESGNYSMAVEIFHAVIAADSGTADAYNGLGWSFAFSDQFDSAMHYFEVASNMDTMAIDPLAGMSAINLAEGDYTESIALAANALALDSNWTFQHADGIDNQDLHLIMAEAYFALGESRYPDALARVKFLDPTCTLSPDDSETWNGHPTYAAALLKKIEALEAVIGAEVLL